MQHFPLTEKLHTDILEEKYGPIHSVVLKHDVHIREALLVDATGTARTYAVTFLEKKMTGELEKINKEIQYGKPIGKAFREHGFIVRKNVLTVFVIKIPQWLKIEFDTKATRAKVRTSEFYAKKEKGKPAIYGTVAEVYTPDFRKATVNAVDKAQVSALSRVLEKQGLGKEEIWQRIGNENNYDDIKSTFLKAKKESRRAVRELKKHIIREMQNPC